ncbi:hypothetical protein [Soonwooa sp.]|uniref:hypothetical protein n=1 Tax=Soonwooa sp. TaxID=1938592 RepID=UPI0028A9FDCB|nr:hypothetical protein [Soonwooa sp.]
MKTIIFLCVVASMNHYGQEKSTLSKILEGAHQPIGTSNTSMQTIDVCAGDKIPEGYVIIFQGHSSNCRYSSSPAPNFDRVSQPSDNLLVCSQSKVPNGFVLTNVERTSSCNSYGTTATNSFRINLPKNNMEICYNSPIPSGFHIVRKGSSMKCPNYSATGTNTVFISNQ